ncbi:MAG: hypothetical protein ACUVQ0_04210 [Thermoproteota archaeon]
MEPLESTPALILTTLLLILIVAVSKSIRIKLELSNDLEKNLEITLDILKICEEGPIEIDSLMERIRNFLDSNGIKWVIIEISSRKQGFSSMHNSLDSLKEKGYTRVVKVITEDIVYVVVGIEND